MLIALSTRRTHAGAVVTALGRWAPLDARALLHVGVGGVLALAFSGVWRWANGRSLMRDAREEKGGKDDCGVCALCTTQRNGIRLSWNWRVDPV